jgi:tellurite resistance protein TehA-like permease
VRRCTTIVRTDGRAGYTAAALISLGTQAPNVIPTNAFNVDSLPDGAIVKALGVISGIFLVLFSAWFFIVSTVAVLADVRKMRFSLNWWAFVFPNAGLTLAAIQTGKALKSPGINGVCSALTILLVVMWIVTAVAHILALRGGEIMWPGKDEDKDLPDE